MSHKHRLLDPGVPQVARLQHPMAADRLVGELGRRACGHGPFQLFVGLDRTEVVGAKDHTIVRLDLDPDVHPHEVIRADKHQVAASSEELSLEPWSFDSAAGHLEVLAAAVETDSELPCGLLKSISRP